ncbi:MAG: nucleotidyltransferase family protein [Lentisphaerota bacterium]
MEKLSPEETILCSILNGKTFDTKLPEEIWESVYKLTRLYNLLPLIFHKIKQLKLALPEKTESKFKKDYLWFVSKDLQRKKQLYELIKLLNENDIDHILLKGSHIAETIYKNSALRTMSDIDILINKADFEKAYKTLSKEGYRNSTSNIADSELLPYKDKHFNPLIKDGCIPVEFHWNIHRAYDYNKIQSLWKRAVSVNINSLKTKVLSTEDLLIHICVHKGCDDDFISSLVMLSDIKEIESTITLDWDKVYDLTLSEWHNTKSIFSALYLYNKLLAGNISDEFLKKIKPDDFSEEIEALLIRQVFSTRKVDLSTLNTFNAVSKIREKSNPLYIFRYLMSPRRLCLRYDRKFSVAILPYLYCRRILEKTAEALKLLSGSSKEKGETYNELKTSYKLKKWLED